jgi:flagellin-like protein
MKGISPMIAVVLLIAFVVAVGSIISLFLTGLATTQTERTATEAEKIIRCGPTVLRIDEVYYDATDYDPLKVTVTYVSGTEKLTDFTVTLIDKSRVSNVTDKTATAYDMSPGEIQVFTGLDTGGLSGELQEVRVQAFCLKTQPVSAECEEDEPCMQLA